MHQLKDLASGQLLGARHIRLSENLHTFPDELFSLAETLEILDLSHNRLSSLPSDFGRFKKLKILFCSENCFTELPAVLGTCENLEMIGFKSNQISHVPELALPRNTRWLILTNNKLTQLPASIGKCTRLQKLALAGNKLTQLPAEMTGCINLELIRISANAFKKFPEVLLSLPKLTWLAFAGNPFNQQHMEAEHPPEVPFHEFTVLNVLGEGASGTIYKAEWKTKGLNVALKLFKGDVTSDGYPVDEMLANIAAGNHPNLIPVLGKIKDHPEGKNGLILTLIPAGYKNLGLPPSLQTCTRDTFAQGTQFTLKQIQLIMLQMTDVMQHLHARGILHGDVYAHNMLIDEHTHCLKGDFGAASFYPVQAWYARQLERMESRALGCLLDDLLELCPEKDNHSTLALHLKNLRNHLIYDEKDKRPLPSAILSELRKWEAEG